MNKEKPIEPIPLGNVTEHPEFRKFFSLKWKAILWISIILIIINISFSTISYLNLIKQHNNQNKLAFRRYSREIEALVEQSLKHMLQIASMLPVLTYAKNRGDNLDLETLTRLRERHWPALLLNMGIDTVRFYNHDNRLIIDWGNNGLKKDIPPFISKWIMEINRLEQPMTLIDCTKDCIQYAATPMLSSGQNAGVVLVGSSLADIVLNFKQVSGIDMGIAIFEEGRNHITKGDERMLIDSWGARVIALTDINHNMPILKKLAHDYPEVHVFKGVRTTVSDRTFEVKLVPFNNFHVNFKGNGYLILIADVSKSISEINSALKQTILICITGLLVSVGLLLLVLWRPLSRLRRTAFHLPLLAENRFKEARTAIHREYRSVGRKDEVDVLIDISTKLSYQLEGLAWTVARHIDELSLERDFIRSLLDTAQVIILIQNRPGEITLLNLYGCTLSMYAEEEIIGKQFSGFLIKNKDIVDFKENFEQILNGEIEQFSNESTVVCKDGSTRQVVWNHCLLPDKSDKDPMVLSVGLDISERKKAEDDLIKSEKHLQAIFRAANNVSFITTELEDKNFRILDFSFGSERIFGYNQKNAVGRPLEILYLPDNTASISKTYRLMLDKGGEITRQLDLMRKSGKEFPAVLTAYPIFDADNNIIQALWVAFDISEIKELYKEKESLTSQLRQSQKMEAVGTLAGGIAHDFNNILQSISGYTQLLLMTKEEDDPDYAKLMTIDKSVNRASNLTKQLLIFSRKMESELKPVNLNNEIRQISKILKRTLPKMIDIELDLDDELKMTNADSVQLEQIMMNLAINARDAMPSGGKLIFRTRNLILGEEYRRNNMEIKPGEYIQLTVSDTGHGIDKETQEHIFEPFYTTKETGKGTGLGLAMVYGIIKNHRGQIVCQSKPGKGTHFHIFLPVLKTRVNDNKEQSIKQRDAEGGTETILIVDDEEIILEIEKEALTQAGYNVLMARRGEEALDIFGKNKELIDLVILDLNMPGIGGHTCLVELKKIDPDVKVIVSTGYSNSSASKETIELTSEAMINKPYRFADLFIKIREILGK